MTVTDWYLRHLPGWSVSPGSDYHYFSVPPLCLILVAAVTSVPSLEKPSSVSSVQLSCSVVSDSWRPHGLQHARPPCPSPTPRVYSNSCPSRWWCHPTISSSVNLYIFNLSQHQSLFEWISSSHQVAKVLEFQLQHQAIYTLQKNPPNTQIIFFNHFSSQWFSIHSRTVFKNLWYSQIFLSYKSSILDRIVQ